MKHSLNLSSSNIIKENNVQEKYDYKRGARGRESCKFIFCLVSLILFIFAFIFIFVIHPNIIDKKDDKKRKISGADLANAKYNTILKLNNIVYPLRRNNYIYKEEYLSSFYIFTCIFFNKSNFKDFSPISLYNVLINVYMGISDEELSKKLNNILGLNETERILFYSQIIQNNYFNDSKTEIKISNGGFYNSDIVTENKSYVDKLTETYTECYKLSYEKNFDNLLDWINKAVKDNNFINKEAFKNLDKTNLLLFSTIYYQQKWKYEFIDSKIYKGPFYINSNEKKEITFMNHIYIIDYYYDYEDYYSFFDFYSNEYIINYLVPKSINKNILDLIKDKNFLIEDEAVKEEDIAIDLSVPKFKREINLDIIPILKELGLDKLFNESYSTFNHPFIVENKKNYYLNQIFHKNIIELNEDGTAIKSIKHESSSNMIGNTLEMNALKINLDRPFIYIIKDKNKLPIFIGYIDNPTE